MPSPESLNPTTRFSDRVDDYVRYRPSYPEAAVGHVLAGLCAPRVVDVAAGTGIWTAQLAARGLIVIALEPNADMRAAAPALAGVTWQGGTAESTGLAAASADVLTAAQAFHWFRAPEAIHEFARVLVPGGRLAVVWNRRESGDPFTNGYGEAILAIGGVSVMEGMNFDPAVIHAGGEFAPAGRASFPHEQVLDRAGLHGRARSASYVPKAGPSAEELRARLDQLFDRHVGSTGRVRLRYECEVWLASRL